MRTFRSVRSLLLRSLWSALALLAFSSAASAQVGVYISVGFPPPELPVYEQPICPGDGYIWTPGYWAWDGYDYYWVPGTWVLAPEVGYFWTPPYWGWGGAGFIFHEGYWGPVVGFYGGINYGYGYFGHGYEGGRWDHDHFFYNREVNNINVTEIHNVYNTRITNYSSSHVSYNGGQGGINARPTSQEQTATRERHLPPIAAQTQHVQEARGNQQLRASVNHGRPPIAATSKPTAFNERGVTPATSAPHYNPPNREVNTAVHPNQLPIHTRPPSSNSVEPKGDQKYQQEQEKLYQKQQQEHQKLQQQQDKEHQQYMKQQADEAKMRQLEQKHQQQTQQMEQRHVQEQQRMTQHQPPPHQAPPTHQEPPPHH